MLRKIPQTMIEDMNKSFWSLFMLLCNILSIFFLIISSHFFGDEDHQCLLAIRQMFRLFSISTVSKTKRILEIQTFSTLDASLALVRSKKLDKRTMGSRAANFSQNSQLRNGFERSGAIWSEPGKQ
jgi:hypothetical protein